MSDLFDFAVTTIFAREVLEGSIIIGEYRTVIMRGDSLPEGITQKQALRAVTVAALVASAFAVVVCAAVAIPLAILSNDFNPSTSKIIEGISKIVAAICILQLSLKFPKWLGVYAKKKKSGQDGGDGLVGLSLSSIRFNVAWNIWREVAECGVFLLPFFLSGEGVTAIPLSALLGTVVGLLLGLALYYANKRLTNKLGLAIFTAALLLVMSAGLFTGGCHNLETVWGGTATIWTLHGDFWSVNRLPMTVFKPFGYSDSRTVLQLVCFWLWLLVGCVFHYCKWRSSQKLFKEQREQEENSPSEATRESYITEAERSLSCDRDIEDQRMGDEIEVEHDGEYEDTQVQSVPVEDTIEQL